MPASSSRRFRSPPHAEKSLSESAGNRVVNASNCSKMANARSAGRFCIFAIGLVAATLIFPVHLPIFLSIGATCDLPKPDRTPIFRARPGFSGGNKMGTVSLFNSDTLSNSSLYSTQTTQTTQQTVQTANSTASTANASQDTVKLSETAQAKLLYDQGKSVSLIASSLGTTTKEINNDLGIAAEQAMEKALQETEAATTKG